MKNTIDYLLTTLMLTTALSVGITIKAESKPIGIGLKFDTNTHSIQGQSGGPINSKGCGYIAASPNHVLNIPKRLDYMRLTVQASGGQPTLLVKGPSSTDSFCVLGDEVSGFKPEISGVWEPGEYQIYVGDRTGNNYQFTLNISTK